MTTTPAAAILALLLSRAPYTGDHESAAQREARLAIVAESISLAARSRVEVATLVALGEHESGFAALVQYGRCSELPKGQRCDNGRARGPWQLHLEACRDAWAFPEGSDESIRAEAVCAVRLLRWNAQRGREHTVTPLHAAFAGYAARGWGWPGAERRVKTTREILARWQP